VHFKAQLKTSDVTDWTAALMGGWSLAAVLTFAQAAQRGWWLWMAMARMPINPWALFPPSAASPAPWAPWAPWAAAPLPTTPACVSPPPAPKRSFASYRSDGGHAVAQIAAASGGGPQMERAANRRRARTH
jgi:hypothetical protein